MAYLYKGMAALGQGSDVSGSVLLTWHEKVSHLDRQRRHSMLPGMRPALRETLTPS